MELQRLVLVTVISLSLAFLAAQYVALEVRSGRLAGHDRPTSRRALLVRWLFYLGALAISAGYVGFLVFVVIRTVMPADALP
jgi:hypothetical protein